MKRDETSNAHVAWSVPRAGSYMATPIVLGDHLYVVRWNGILGVYDARIGPTFQLVATNKLDAAMLATPAISDGRLFIRTTNEVLAFGN